MSAVVNPCIERAKFAKGFVSELHAEALAAVQAPQDGALVPPLDCKHWPNAPAAVEPIAEVPLPKRIPYGVSVLTPVPPLLTVRASAKVSELPLSDPLTVRLFTFVLFATVRSCADSSVTPRIVPEGLLLFPPEPNV